MTNKTCIVCGVVSDKERCKEHALPKKGPDGWAKKDASHYDWHWHKLSRMARRRQPWCTDCGQASDLQCDHSKAAWERKAKGKPIRLQDVDVVCGECNRKRGQARFTRGDDLQQGKASALGGHPNLQIDSTESPERTGWAFTTGAVSSFDGKPGNHQGTGNERRRRRVACF